MTLRIHALIGVKGLWQPAILPLRLQRFQFDAQTDRFFGRHHLNWKQKAVIPVLIGQPVGKSPFGEWQCLGHDASSYRATGRNGPGYLCLSLNEKLKTCLASIGCGLDGCQKSCCAKYRPYWCLALPCCKAGERRKVSQT